MSAFREIDDDHVARERVGLIGLGVMGRPMARNISRAGHDLVVSTRNQSVLDEFRHEGFEVAPSPAEVASNADIVITMLPNGEAVRQVLEGEHGVFAGIRPGALVIDMSTIEPRVARELAEGARERGVGMLDAPVSGGDVGAREARLSIMVGGSEEDFLRAHSVLAALGSTITHVGPHGAGQVVKACNQAVVATIYGTVAEALVLASKAGVSPALTLDVLSGGLAANRIIDVRRQNFLDHSFAPGFRIDLHHKDLGIALETGGELDVPLPLAAAVQQMFVELRALGYGGLDHSALLMVAEGRAAHRIAESSGDHDAAGSGNG